MPIDFPETQEEVLNRSQVDIQNTLVDSNPFLPNSYLLALITAFSFRIFDFYIQMDEVIKELLPDTATGGFAERWGSFKDIDRNPASTADGFLTIEGVLSTVIPIGTAFQSSNSLEFKTLATVSIGTHILAVTSITRSGSTATVTTFADDHKLAVNINVEILGADQAEYNGTFQISEIIALNKFKFEVTGTPATPATGTITSTSITASLEVQSTIFGQTANLPAGEALTIATPILGVNTNGYIQFGQISGGTDIEDDEDYRARYLETYRDQPALFNVATIIATAKTISGVTRVFVEEITPAPGQVTVYFTRDNDESIIPSAGEVADVKAALDAIKPAHMETDDLIVAGPIPNPVDFVFTSLVPNNTTMQASIQANLDQFFRERTVVGEDIFTYAYESAIYQTVDSETGDIVTSFTLSAPAGDVSIADDEIGILRDITWP